MPNFTVSQNRFRSAGAQRKAYAPGFLRLAPIMVAAEGPACNPRAELAGLAGPRHSKSRTATPSLVSYEHSHSVTYRYRVGWPILAQ